MRKLLLKSLFARCAFLVFGGVYLCANAFQRHTPLMVLSSPYASVCPDELVVERPIRHVPQQAFFFEGEDLLALEKDRKYQPTTTYLLTKSFELTLLHSGESVYKRVLYTPPYPPPAFQVMRL